MKSWLGRGRGRWRVNRASSFPRLFPPVNSPVPPRLAQHHTITTDPLRRTCWPTTPSPPAPAGTAPPGPGRPSILRCPCPPPQPPAHSTRGLLWPMGPEQGLGVQGPGLVWAQAQAQQQRSHHLLPQAHPHERARGRRVQARLRCTGTRLRWCLASSCRARRRSQAARTAAAAVDTVGAVAAAARVG